MHIFATRKTKYLQMKKLNPFILLLMLALTACNSPKPTVETTSNSEVKGDLIIFHAGSLSVPLKKMGEAFKKEYPEVNLIMEADGSRKCARKITDLNKSCDIMASADYTVIDKLLIPDFAEWNIKFATNEMTLVYLESSKYANQINQQNWFEILMKDDVVFGRSDPNSDPCGYRALLTNKLAERFYKIPGLADQLSAKNTNYIRPKETDLLALLETGTIDYIYLYRSVAQQHGLKYLVLPDSINLKNPKLDAFYAEATVEVTGSEPGEMITKKGQSMVYGITIPKNAPNPITAEAFLKFLLEKEKGMTIMEQQGQPSIVPSPTHTFSKIPESLKSFATN